MTTLFIALNTNDSQVLFNLDNSVVGCCSPIERPAHWPDGPTHYHISRQYSSIEEFVKVFKEYTDLMGEEEPPKLVKIHLHDDEEYFITCNQDDYEDMADYVEFRKREIESYQEEAYLALPNGEGTVYIYPDYGQEQEEGSLFQQYRYLKPNRFWAIAAAQDADEAWDVYHTTHLMK